MCVCIERDGPSRSMVALTKAQKRETPMEPKDSMAQ